MTLAALLLSGSGIALSQAASKPTPEIPQNIIQIIKKQCTSCHTGSRPPMGLSLIPSKIAAAVDAPSREIPKLKLLDTADPEASYLLKKIEGARDITGSRMPKGKHLAEADLEALKAWILSLKKS
jgi:hypothetical protein